MSVQISERIAALRNSLQAQHFDGMLIPSTDQHKNEYVPACWRRREYLSGFTGSAGTLLIGREKAWLWTDSRYFTQAALELQGSDIQLCKQGEPDAPTVNEILQEHFSGLRLCIDPSTISISAWHEYEELLNESGGTLATVSKNPVDQIWLQQPKIPAGLLEILDVEMAGTPAHEKLASLRQRLRKENATPEYVYPMYALDEIAWLFNIRGSDVTHTPVKLAFALIEDHRARIYISGNEEISQEQISYFDSLHTEVKPYDEFIRDLWLLEQTAFCTPQTPAHICQAIQQFSRARLKFIKAPIPLAKACKNPVEQKMMRQSHIKDAAALAKFFSWLETHWRDGITEYEIGERVLDFRMQQAGFKEPSFATIAGFAENGAIVHYRASLDSAQVVNDSSLLLLDSGGQYYAGTTDVTRTIHLGNPTEEQKKHYTLVLKGHLALSRAVFPEGTPGEALDILARQHLWTYGLDYRHGTGHGVGSFLGVHEGPQSISPRRTRQTLLPGMVVSNEPGLYLEGKYGIRIENLILVTPSKDHRGYLKFEQLTLVPYCRKLIDLSLLTKVEQEQIDAYHSDVLRIVSPLLDTEPGSWLEDACAPL